MKNVRLGIFASPHGNLQALLAVMAQMDCLKIQDRICLGDLIGYGPSPVEVVDVVMKQARVCIRGDFDDRLVNGTLDGFNKRVRQSLNWHLGLLRPGILSPSLKARSRWKFLNSLQESHAEQGLNFCHGSPRDIQEYVMPADVQFGLTPKMNEIFGAFPNILFVANSLREFVITESGKVFRPGPDLWEWSRPSDAKAIVGVGSVGRPLNPRRQASFVEVTDEAIRFHRVDYDYEATITQLEELGQLDFVRTDSLRPIKTDT